MKVENNLNDFTGWDDKEDFFEDIDSGISETNDSSDNKNSDDKSSDESDNESDESNSKTKKEDNLFEDLDQGNENENENVEKPKKDKSDSSLSRVFKKLADKGYLENLPEEIEDEDEFLDNSLDQIVESKVRDLFRELPQELRQLNQFVLKGGDMKEFLATLSKQENHVDILSQDDIDLDDEEVQEQVVRELLKNEDPDLDDDDIEAQIEALKNRDKLGDFAQKKYSKYLKKVEYEREQILKEQEHKRRLQKEELKEYKENTYKFLQENKSIGEIDFSKDDKENLPSYIYDKTIPLQNGSKISNFEKDLFYEVLGNSTTALQLAVLLRNRNSDGSFNFKKIKEKLRTELSKNVKDNIRRTKETMPTGSKSTGSSSIVNLASIFD